MSMFQKKTKPEASPVEPASKPVVAPTTPRADDRTIIGRGVQIKGGLSGENDVEIRGKVHGNCEVRAELTVRPGGRILGEVTAAKLILAGEVLGNVRAEEVRLEGTAKLKGDVTTKKLVIAEGAELEGRVDMSGRERHSILPAPAEQRAAAQ